MSEHKKQLAAELKNYDGLITDHEQGTLIVEDVQKTRGFGFIALTLRFTHRQVTLVPDVDDTNWMLRYGIDVSKGSTTTALNCTDEFCDWYESATYEEHDKSSDTTYTFSVESHVKVKWEDLAYFAYERYGDASSVASSETEGEGPEAQDDDFESDSEDDG